MGPFAKATALSLRDQVMDEFWEPLKCIWNSKWGLASYVAVSEDSGFKRLLKCLDCKHILWDTEVISKNFGPNNHFKFIFSLECMSDVDMDIECQRKAFTGDEDHLKLHSKKCWVILTQFWVKYGQTQPLGYIFKW